MYIYIYIYTHTYVSRPLTPRPRARSRTLASTPGTRRPRRAGGYLHGGTRAHFCRCCRGSLFQDASSLVLPKAMTMARIMDRDDKSDTAMATAEGIVMRVVPCICLDDCRLRCHRCA